MVCLDCYIPIVVGSISFISSMTVIIMLLRSKKALSITYHRILLVLSIIDIFVSLGFVAGCFPTGNQFTCEIQGAFIFGSTAQPLCYCSPQLYYLLAIKYGMKPEDVRTRVEPFLLSFPVIYASIGSAVCAFTQSINRTDSLCYIALGPPGCDEDQDECNRGKNIILFQLLFGAIPIVTSCITMSVTMGMIYYASRSKEMLQIG